MLKLKETAVENGLISKYIPSGCSKCLRSHLNNKTITVKCWSSNFVTRLISEFQIGFYIYFKLLKKTDSGLKMVLKSNWICPQQILCSFLNNKTVAINVREGGFGMWRKVMNIFHSSFFCRFTFKSINHEVDNLVSVSRRIIGTLSCTQQIVIVNC